jgi:hypothetical protein
MRKVGMNTGHQSGAGIQCYRDYQSPLLGIDVVSAVFVHLSLDHVLNGGVISSVMSCSCKGHLGDSQSYYFMLFCHWLLATTLNM